MAELGLNYYSYIEEFPYYIHNDTNNLLNTAKTIYDKMNPGNKELINHPYVRRMIEFQIERENNILSQLGIQNEETLEELFIRTGLIESNDLQAKLIMKLDEIKDTESYGKIENIRGQISKSNDALSPEDFNNDIENIFEEFKTELNRIRNEMQDIINEYEKENNNEISLNVLLKLKDYVEQDFNKEDKDYISKLYRHTKGLKGKLSNYYRSIMEEIRKASENEIDKYYEDDFVLIENADKLRARQVKNAFRLAKADKLIGKITIKDEETFIIPIGGITAKKSKTKRVKLNDTSSVNSFLDSIKKNSGFLDEKEVDKDIKEIEYLIRNSAFHDFQKEKVARLQDALQYFGSKYSYSFLANGIFKEIINQDTSDILKYESMKEVLNYEHADFLFAIINNKTIIKRVSEELEEIIKNSNASISSNYNIGGKGNTGTNAKKAKTKAFTILEELQGIKKTIQPFSYEKAIHNSLIINKMESIKTTMQGNMQIMVTAGVING